MIDRYSSEDMAPDQRPILDYSNPPELKATVADSLIAGALHLAVYITVAIFLFASSYLASSLLHGTWYFWHSPEWIFSIDQFGISLGPSKKPFSVGMVGGHVVRMLVIGIPTWSIWRFWPRKFRAAEA